MTAWLDRYPQVCVTVIDAVTAPEAFTRFGGEPAALAQLDGPAAARLWREGGFRPVLRVAEREGSAVLIEFFSAEGLRREVLRRASAATRVVAVLWSGAGATWLGHARDGRVGPVFEPAGRPEEMAGQARVLAEAAGAPVSALAVGDEPVFAVALRWMRELCGLVLTEELMRQPAPTGAVLPVLADPVLPAPDPAMVEAVAAVDDARIAAALGGLLRDAAVELGLDADPAALRELEAAIGARDRAAVPDGTPLDVALRTAVADGLAAEPARNEPRLRRTRPPESFAQALARAETARIVHAVLVREPRAVAVTLAGQWLGGQRRRRLLAALGLCG